jgi:hypothetical protein
MTKVEQYRAMAIEDAAKSLTCSDPVQRSQPIEIAANWEFPANERLKILESRLVKDDPGTPQ